MRNFLIVLVLVLYLLLGWKMGTDYRVCCLTAEDNKLGVICFGQNSCDLSTGADLQSLIDSLSTLVVGDRMLRITGIYSTDESYDGTASNLGHCRAEQIRELFSTLSDDQIALSGQLSIGREVSDHMMYSLDLIDSVDSDRDITSSATTVIYFPFNSTNKLNDREIEDYLRRVAASIKDNGGTVHISGHTDDIGSARSNIKLGQRRANIIADYLIGQGVLRAQIVAESKGESEPIASNSNEVGRAQNRRTELQIIQ